MLSLPRTSCSSCWLLLLLLGATALLQLSTVVQAAPQKAQHHHDDGEHKKEAVEHQEPAGAAAAAVPSDGGLSVTFQEGYPNWRLRQLLGQVSGVSVDARGHGFLFQRADRPWQADDFDEHDRYTKIAEGPIQVSTIVELDASGRLVGSLGEDTFYLPHGITADKDGHLWTTDVARHQVIRINRRTRKPDLVLGEKFVPGSDSSHFCKPTKVAVASDGHFFVADGYCNSRVMKFDPSGKYVGEFGKKPAASTAKPSDKEFLIPHGLALLESLDLLCVADREHRRAQCFHAGLRQAADFGRFVRSIGAGGELGRVFDVAFDAAGNLLALHQEPESGVSLVSAYRPETGALVTRFTFVPEGGGDFVGFGDGHSVAASPRGDYILVGSLTAVCDGDADECFGEQPDAVPYQVFRFNMDRPVSALVM